MADYVKHHYVPQYYFKLFSKGDRRIHLLFKKDERIILNASIKDQCYHNKFYGTTSNENLLSTIEAVHSKTLKKILAIVWNEVEGPYETEVIAKDFSLLWEIPIFQRSRSKLQIHKESPAMESMCLEFFRLHLESQPNAEENREIIEQIKKGNIRVIESPQHAILRSLDVGFECTKLFSDLNFYFLRNCTGYPFLFSDSPVVFCNTYYKNVKDRGVLGAQTPGLQIFYPLDSDTLLMLIDDQVYGGWYKNNLVVDLVEESDVSQLNALQLHHSSDSVYFADACYVEYVERLWNIHKHFIQQPRMIFKEEKGWLVDGKPVDGILYHTYEPQLNINLDLSFIECTPIKASDYKPRKRDPELVKKYGSKRPGLEEYKA